MERNARDVALRTLAACGRQGAWSDGALKRNIRDAGLDGRDAALATQLCAGVLQNRALCDYYIAAFSSVNPQKMEEKVLEALRLGVYQLLFLDKIPDRAAVSSSVDLARQYAKNPRAAGLVNGVLRAVARNREAFPALPEEPVKRFSLLYSHPEWLVREWFSLIGEEETEALLQLDNRRPEVTIQTNTLKCSGAELAAHLTEEGVTVRPHPYLPDCFYLSGTGDLEQLNAWKKGLFYVQDAAARMAVLAAGLKPDQRVLDTCAAPGGKSFAAAVAMKNEGSITSCDIHPHKLKLISAGAQRLGLSLEAPQLQNGGEFRPEWENAFDAVITDVPCSGLGVIRKKPDIRYKDPDSLNGLPAVQERILCNAARYVRPGGTLLYSTCTLRPGENQDVVRRFLDSRNDFTYTEFELPDPIGRVEEGMLTLWPQRTGTDGFFIARLMRRDA